MAPSNPSNMNLGRWLVDLRPELLGRALRLTRNLGEADDLLQDTCERALRFGLNEGGSHNVRAWLYQVMFSIFVSRYRRSRRERRVLDRAMVDENLLPHGRVTGEPAKVLPLLRPLRAIVDSLPEQFRTTIDLVDVRDFTYREAAAALGVPIGTVMSRLHRARKLLATQLADAA